MCIQISNHTFYALMNYQNFINFGNIFRCNSELTFIFTNRKTRSAFTL